MEPNNGADYCSACCGLHQPPEHDSASCPLLRSAKRWCECANDGPCSWTSPACDRTLFALLVCVQVYDALVAEGSNTPQALKGMSTCDVVALHGVGRFWGGEVPTSAFDKFVRIDAYVGAPVPALWRLREPLMMCVVEQNVEGCFGVMLVEPPLPLVAAREAIVAEDWLDFLAHAASGSVTVVKAGRLVPCAYRQHIQVHERSKSMTVVATRWTPIMFHTHRGFLVEKDGKRRWKPLHELTPAKILDYEGRLARGNDARGKYGHTIEIVETTDSVEGADELDGRRRDSVGPVSQPSSHALSWYHAFSRGLAESDGEEEDAQSRRSTDSKNNLSGGEEEDEEEKDELEQQEVAMERGFAPANSDATATGSYRDKLADFAAQYAREQADTRSSPSSGVPVNRPKRLPEIAKAHRRKKEKVPIARKAAKRLEESARVCGDSMYRKMERVCWCRGVYMIPLLAIVAGTMALIGAALEFFPFVATNVLLSIARLTNLTIVNWVLYLLWMAAFSALAVFLTVHLFPVCAGSGIPEIRAILSGSSLPQYLKRPVFPVKVIGTMAMACSGLWVGKEGPSVHIACLLGCFVVRSLPIFEAMRSNRTLYRWLLSSCAALGPAAVFGSPIGGVLFAIEATTSYFSVTELFYAFIAAVPSALLIRLLIGVYRTGYASFLPITQVLTLRLVVPDAGEFFWAMLMAVLLGFLGTLFIELSSQIVAARRWLFRKSPLLGHQLMYFLFVLLLSAVLFYPGFIGEFMSENPLRVMLALTNSDRATLVADGWLKFDIRGSCAIFFVVKSLMLVLIVSFPAPTGVFLPTLAAGAAFGRMWGEFYQNIVPLAPGVEFATGLNPWGFAFIGSACMGASVTHTVSVAVIVLEVIGQGQLLIPVLCATIVSLVTSRLTTGGVGVYERIAFDRKLPFLFDLPISSYVLRAVDLLVPIDWEDPTGLKPQNKRARVIENLSTLDAIDAILDNDFSPTQVFPVVESFQSQMLLGLVSGFDLMRYRADIIRKLEKVSYSVPLPREALLMSSLHLLSVDAGATVGGLPSVKAESGQNDPSSRQNVAAARNLLQTIQDSVSPLRVTKVHLTVSPASPITFIHQLMSLNGPKADVIPVADKGRLVGLIFRSDMILRLTPKRFSHVAAPVAVRAAEPPAVERAEVDFAAGRGQQSDDVAIETEFSASCRRID